MNKLIKEQKKISYCLDCNKIICTRSSSIRCNSCAAKKRSKDNPNKYYGQNLPKNLKGKNNGNYKHGLSHTKLYRWIQYGGSIEEYKQLYKKQKGSCAICKIKETELKNNFSIDHNHKTNKIRGLLCNKCNVLLGFAKDNIKLLKSAIKYLRENKK